MSTKSPTFILIPGHWHTTVHMQPLLNILEKKGHAAKSVQLRSVGLKSPRPTFQDDVTVIYNAVSHELETGADVCLVVHSYGGMPGAESINKLIADGALESRGSRGKLVKAVFIAAFALPAGLAMDAKDFISPDDPGFSIDENDMIRTADPAHYFYNDLSPAAAKPWIDALDVVYYMQPCPVISSEEWRKAPVTALLCKRDNSVPPDRQEMMWQGMDSEWMDSAHTPYVSQPENLAQILLRLVK